MSRDFFPITNNAITGVKYNRKKITKVVIPDGVTIIEGNAFSGCTGLTSVTIPNSVTKIGWKAFSGCTGLKEVIAPRECKFNSNAFPDGCKVIRY